MRFTRYAAICTAAVAMCALCAIANPLPAAAKTASESQRQIDIAAARAQRKAIVSANMNLTDKEAKGFWPVYDAYEARMDKLDKRHADEVKEYAKHYETLTDKDAERKLHEVIAIREAQLHVQKEYIPKFSAVLTPIQVTRFYQIDNKLRAMVQCDIAQIVPLARPGKKKAAK